MDIGPVYGNSYEVEDTKEISRVTMYAEYETRKSSKTSAWIFQENKKCKGSFLFL